MATHLGVAPSEVHDAADEVLDFWFGALTPEQWFTQDDAVDRACEARFGAMRDGVLAAGAAGWRERPETLLAAILLLDQVSRNIHRGSADAFAADPLAEELTRLAISRGWVNGFPVEQAQFLLMPLMHAEDRATQALSVSEFERLGNERNIDFARQHAEVIARFGRFPSRNAALGRQSTPDEVGYLSEPRGGWEK